MVVTVARCPAPKNVMRIFSLRRRACCLCFPGLTHRQNIKEHRDTVTGITLVIISQFEQSFDAEASLEEGIDVSLEGTMFPTEGHSPAVTLIHADA